MSGMIGRVGGVKIWVMFAVIAGAFLGPAVVGKKVLSQADVLYFLSPWSVCRPADLTRASNYMLGDQTVYFHPHRDFAHHQVREGKIPLWNPFLLMGTPFLANMQSAVFSPFQIFSYLGEFKRSFAWSALCRLILAGVGTYYFCRLLGMAMTGASLAGISFMLCGFQVVWLGFAAAHVSVLLPWLLVAMEKIVTTQDRRAVLLVAVVVAALLLGGHPETAMHIALGGGMFLLYRLGQQWWAGDDTQTLGGALLRAASGAVLGVGLAAVVLFPFVELLGQSGIWHMRGSFPRNPFVLPPSTLLMAVAPDLFGNPVYGSDYGPSNYNERVAYAGLLPLLLALLSLWHWRRDPRVRFFSTWGLFCLIIVFGVWPIFDVVTSLPLLHHAPNHRLLLWWQFCVAVLAGLSVDRIILLKQERKNALPDRFFVLSSLLCLLPLVFWLIPQLEVVQQKPLALYGAIYPIVVGSAALALLGLFRQEKIRPQTWGAAACTLALCDLFAFGYWYNPTVSTDRVFTCAPNSIRFLQSQDGLFRIAGVDRTTLIANTGMVYGLQDIRGYELPAPERLAQFFTEGLKGLYFHGAHYQLHTLDVSTLRLLSLANVRYLVSTHALTDVDVDLQNVYSGEMQIYENPNVLPRAFLVHQVQAATNGQDALARVMDAAVNLQEVGIIEGEHHDVSTLAAMGDELERVSSGSCTDKVQIVDYEPHRVRLQVDACAPGIVVLTDTYYPGWKTFVDGNEQRMYRADYLFRGVHTQAGRHEVQFLYDPISYKAGVVVSVASVLGCLLLWPWDRKRR